jgi:D-alanine-D-alanine ligase
MPRLTVGVVFGGVSPEHEVSVISALQAAAALDRERYDPVPIYIAKDGAWYTGDDRFLEPARYKDLDWVRREATPVRLDPRSYRTLKLVEARTPSLFNRSLETLSIDVMLLGLHGGAGENGGLQGLCDAFNVPYTGSGIFGSALGIDKVLSKMLCRDQDIPIVDFVAFRESDWGYREEEWLARCEEQLGFPVIVKPARLGSSIGIAKADDRTELDAAIEEALRYDEKVVVELAVQNLREVNCSVLGDVHEAQASVLEEPVRTAGEALLSFEEKYMRGGQSGGKGSRGSKVPRRSPKQSGAEGMASLDRVIPAPLPDEKTREIRDLAVRIFQLFECSGVARIDFMINDATGQVYFNEINTIPGSFSFYLWEPSGVSFDELTHRMIELAMKQHRDKNGRVRSYDVNLLSERDLGGLKGAKG